MDDLTQCLYEFLMDRRMGGLWKDEKYKACSLAVETQEERVNSFLTSEQRKKLDQLLDKITEQECLEKAYLFQAVLELVRELNAIVRA